jgi:outer membrane protein OmpA-like peptidoglycan-associated protein
MSAIPPLDSDDAPADADRNERLASLLLEVARAIDPDVATVLPRQLEVDPRLEAVRTVLLRKELDTLAHLERKVDDPEQLADAVSEILPHAVELSGARDERLGHALAPTMERATEASIRRNPGTLVNILYPVMGPAIRKAIAESLSDTLQGLNQALRYAFSLRGLKWRLEAMRSGSSFGDVVLKHTLVFRVEHLFLIHRKSGLLLEHQAAEDAAARDPQLVSGMLTAIQDFVRDSFDDGGSNESSAIDSLRLGDLLLWCEAGPQAYLAAVIRGTPPESLRTTLRDTLSAIHNDLHGALHDYNGDNAVFGDLGMRLEPCLKKQVQAPERRYSPLLWMIPLALLAALGYWLSGRYLEGARVDDYVARLRNEPGIVVTQVERSNGIWHISGMRDPLAIDPREVMQRADLDPGMVEEHWEPYAALSPKIVLRRLKASLPPLPTVRMALDGDIIRVSGGVPVNWLDKARALVKALPVGAPLVDLSALTDVEDPDYLELREEIQSVRIYFDSGAPNPTRDQEKVLDQVAANMSSIMAVAQRLGFSVRLSIIGHADSTGKQTTNLGLSIARAEVVRSLLRSRGIAPDLMSVRGTGTLEPLAEGEAPDDLSLNRCVSFTINTSE